MKLEELLEYADISSTENPMQVPDAENLTPAMQNINAVRDENRQSPRRNSNVGKAKRITNKVKMKKRQSNPKEDETFHQSHIGGHGSSFLFR